MMIHKYDGYGPDGLRRLYKGGGGGSAKYDNLEELYKEQTESARLLREQAVDDLRPLALAARADIGLAELPAALVEEEGRGHSADICQHCADKRL